MKNPYLHMPMHYNKNNYSYICRQFFKYTSNHNESTLYDYLELRQLLSSEKFVLKLSQENSTNFEPSVILGDEGVFSRKGNDNEIKKMCAYRDPQAERILKAIYSYNKEVLMAVKKLKVSEDIMIDCKLRLYNEDLLRKYGQYKVEEAGKIELIEPKTYAQQLVQEMMAKKEEIEKKIQEYNAKHTNENQPEA